jgi:tetratricopeptide (TPR) repeat protein
MKIRLGIAALHCTGGRRMCQETREIELRGMMRPTVIRLAISLLFVVPSIATAAVAVGDTPDLRGRTVSGGDVDISTWRGRLVVVDFWIGRDAANKNDEKSLVQLYNELHPKGFEIVGVCCERRISDVQRYVAELSIPWPQIHEPAEWRGGLGALWGVPQVNWEFLLAPNGKVLYCGDFAHLRAAIEAAMKDSPPQLVDPQILAKANADLDETEKLLRSRDREGAIRRFTQVPEAATKDLNFADRAAGVRGKVNDAADALLADVDALIDKKQYPQAASRLSALLNTMAGLPTASLARQRLAELVAVPEIQVELKKKERADTAESALGEAKKMRDDGKAEEAYEKFQTVATQFADTPAATAAADAVKAYDADPAFQRKMKNRAAAPKARQLLNLAENYRNAGRLDEARKRYQDVINQFPGSSFADTARAELDKIK